MSNYEIDQETAQVLVDTFAPETQYIPAKYVNALVKEASIMGAIGKGVKGIGSAITKKVPTGGGFSSKGGNFGLKRMSGGGGLNVKAFGKSMNVSNQNLGRAAVGGAALGTAGLGAAAGRMTAPKNNNRQY